MDRTDNKVEMGIIKDMNIYPWDRQRRFIKKIYTETPPENMPDADKIMDGLILVVHERNRMEEYRKGRKRFTREEDELLSFANGEINAMCYCLGYDTRL